MSLQPELVVGQVWRFENRVLRDADRVFHVTSIGPIYVTGHFEGERRYVEGRGFVPKRRKFKHADFKAANVQLEHCPATQPEGER